MLDKILQTLTFQEQIHSLIGQNYLQSTVCIGPHYTLIIHKESHGFLHFPPHLTVFPHISSQNLFLLSPTHYFFIRILKKKKKVNLQPHVPRNDPAAPYLNSDLLNIRPLLHILANKPKALYNKFQISVVKPCSHFTSLKQYNIILSLNSALMPYKSINSL